MAMTKPHFQGDKEGIQETDNGFIIRPKGLSIVWGNDERYWKISKDMTEEAAAELIQVSWLEVTGSVLLTPGESYKLTFKVGMATDAFGWKDIQAFLMAKVGKKGKYKWTRVKLQQDQKEKFEIPDDSQQLTIEVPRAATDTTLHFGLYEVWSGKWKGGLKIYNAIVTKTTAGTSTSS
ncbi:hypothetical protein M0R45_013938 [Rubus argutus]|uniref:Uncharacterized protein n=1 Tax=Rubus argutus TaxID=59490 RepID=A0AAW1XJY0_RUBAR